MSLDPVAEDFSVEDFLKPGWETLEGKLSFFSPYFRKMRGEGALMREARSPAGAHMRYADPTAPGGERELLQFGSNNYLGLATEPEVVEKTVAALREFGIGCGGPPLLNGYTRLHRELEARLAALKGQEDALLYASGYSANVGWLAPLLSRQDVLLYDSLSHASLHDGIKMGNFKAIPFAHSNMQDLRKRLMEVRYASPYANLVVAVEGLYSMHGDTPPLAEVRALCDKFSALLAVDDAHGTGVLGQRGHGIHEAAGVNADLVLGTFSKVFAVAGGFIAASGELIDFLRFYSRSYMFSASLPTPTVASVLAGLDFLEAHPERVDRLRENVDYLLQGLRAAGFSVETESAIVPLGIPERVPMQKLIARLQQEGIFVNGITFPAVPKSKQRLRISMMATFTREDLDRALEIFTRVLEEFGLPE